MGRKATPIAAPETLPALDEAVIAEESQALTEVATRERLQASALEIGEQLGIIKSAEFYARCAEKLVVEAFVKLKEGKRYKDLIVTRENGESAPCADLDEACRFFLGKSYRYCAQITQNMETVGAKLFESAAQLGFRTKDYQAIRALPADDQTLVKSAIESATDRDSVTDLIGELTERHAKKLAEKDRVIADLGQKVELKERRIQVLGEERDGLKEKLIGMTLTEDATRKVALEKRARALGALRDASLAMLGYVSRFDQAVANVMALDDATAAAEAGDTLRATYQRLADLANAHGMPVDFAEVVMPPWLADLTTAPAAEAEEF
ncbi:hypothetical protein [Aquabacterium sp.]|uniref:hypothetical protein n=1 Tax=Aquabacterium sp. TaxID=1872578 RepID=UPI00261BDD26|nr:hypothetical protein [Aquabacterium sp.]MDD2978231.1 hypothetical protein [Aquabacterium sp.]